MATAFKMEDTAAKVLKVLFVDDEPHVLSALRRMLRSLGGEIKPSFASNAREGLALLHQEKFDAIVTDMRMPEMNGAKFLAEAMKIHPEGLRFVLSGFSDKELSMQAVHVAHQFLPKPCQKEQLRKALLEGFRLGDRSVMKEWVRRLSPLESIPLHPLTYQRLLDALRRNNHFRDDINQLVAADVGMMAKILQLANSAFFGSKEEIFSLEQATCHIGFDTFSNLVVKAGIFCPWETDQQSLDDLVLLQVHSYLVAGFMRELSVQAGLALRDQEKAEVFGLLKDLGKVILLTCFPDIWAQNRQSLLPKERHQPESNLSESSQLHSRVGALFCGMWGLPSELMEILDPFPQNHESNRSSIFPRLLEIAYMLADIFQFPNGSVELPSSHLDFPIHLKKLERQAVQLLRNCQTIFP